METTNCMVLGVFSMFIPICVFRHRNGSVLHTGSKLCVPYVHAYIPVRWYVWYVCLEARLRNCIYNRLNPPKAPYPPSLVIADIVGMLQVVVPFMLGQVVTEAFGSHRLGGIVVAPQLIEGVEILGGNLILILN